MIRFPCFFASPAFLKSLWQKKDEKKHYVVLFE